MTVNGEYVGNLWLLVLTTYALHKAEAYCVQT